MNPDCAMPARSVCIVVPLCNEEASLPMLGERLRLLGQRLGYGFRLRLLFVDDGSTDRTRELVPSIVPAGVSFEVCRHAHNRGIGAAFRTAFQATAEDIVCTIDADCSYGPEHLAEMIDEVASGRSDISVASPYHPLGGAEGVQRWRLLLSAHCSLLYRWMSPLRLYTYTSIFRAYRGDVARRVAFRSDDFLAAVEILLSASALGYRVSETPMVLHRRSAGVSKMRIAKTIAGHLQLLTSCVTARSGYPSFCLQPGEGLDGTAPRQMARQQAGGTMQTAFRVQRGAAEGPAVLQVNVDGKGALPQ